MKTIQRCTRCIMDNSSDDTIVFDEAGCCNYCEEALLSMGTEYFPNEVGQRKLDQLLQTITEHGKGKQYDAIMGISGGLDSAYLAYLGYKWGLRILLLHVDDGFDTKISQQNLKKLVDATGFDYIVVRPDEEQYCALTKAYLKAGVPNIAVPQDNVLFAEIYHHMRKHKIKYFLSGGNFALERILQRGNTHDAYDLTNIKDIHRKFGEKPIDKLQFISTIRKELDKRIGGIESPRPLNYINYNRKQAFQELYDFCGFEYYGRKHLENELTAFAQLYWFPKKFGVDKRTSHLSSMIISGQMTREEAMAEYSEPLYQKDMMDEYIRKVKEKLQITDSEFEEIMAAPTYQHTDYACEKDRLVWKCLYKAYKVSKRVGVHAKEI